MIQPVSFKGVYRYPQYAFTEHQKKMAEKLENILHSDKYADKKGRTIAEAWDKMGTNLVIIPGRVLDYKPGEERIALEYIHKSKPIKKAYYNYEERKEPGGTGFKSQCIDNEESIVQDLLTRIKNRKKTLRTVRIGFAANLALIFAGFIFIGSGAKCKPLDNLCDKLIKQKTEAIVPAANDTIKKISKDTLNIIKRK